MPKQIYTLFWPYLYKRENLSQTYICMKTQFILLLLGSFCLLSSHPLTLDERPVVVENYINRYIYLSRELNLQTGIPVPIILAVAGLESNWGNSELALNANNHFGIKEKEEWRGNTYCKVTLEYQGWFAYETQACFRQYPLIRESYLDFGRFVTTRENYRNINGLPSWNYRAWMEALHAGGYATDPDYVNKVLTLIWRYRLYELAEE
jgi:flagellum-specific peptidoglycan hydrolase FlgJ